MTRDVPSLAGRELLLREAIVLRHRPDVLGFLARRLKEPQDADDLAQEVCIRFLRLSDSESIQKPLAYLYGIATHVLADFRTAIRREHAHLVIDSDVLAEWSTLPCSAVEIDLGDALALQQFVQRVIAALPLMHAAVLLAHDKDGFTYAEVSARLRLGVHSVKKYLSQAKLRIAIENPEASNFELRVWGSWDFGCSSTARWNREGE